MFRRVRALSAVALLTALAVPGRSGSAAEPDPATANLSSPYVANIYAQVPGPRPWQHPASDAQTADAKIEAAGLHWKYAWLAWSDVEVGPGVYEWDMLDEFVRSAYDHGINLVLQVMVGAWGAPQPWAGPLRVNPGQQAVAPIPQDLTPLRDFWTTLVHRYKPGGVLAQEEGWTEYGVRAYEVENEPDGIPWWGQWTKVPLDYAQYLSVIGPAAAAEYPDVEICGPSLSQNDDANKGLTWLDRMLTPGSATSQWASDTYRAGTDHPAGGPYVDCFSWHRDTSDAGDGSIPARIAALKAVIAAHDAAHQSVDPASTSAPLYFSEGGPLQYASAYDKYAWADAALLAELLAGGVRRMVVSLSAQFNDAAWPDAPVGKMARVFERLFPNGDGMREVSAEVDPSGATTAYVRTDPVTGLRTWILWADYATAPPGQGPELPVHPNLPVNPNPPAPGADYTVTLPVATATAEVIGTDWTSTIQPATGGIEVTLHSDTPSPTVVVSEV